MKKVDLRDFITFLKNPSSGEYYEINSVSSFLKLVWKSFFVLMGIDIIIGILIVIPLRYFNLYPSLNEFKFTPVNILKITIISPVIEELIFRLPLRISKINLAVSFSLIIFLVLKRWCFFNIYLSLSCSSILFFSLYLYFRKGINIYYKLSFFLTHHFRQFFYFMALVFGILHLTNYRVDFRYFYLFPFFAINYLVSGFFWGYLRVRYTYGIYLCIASHIFVNSIYCFVLSR